MWYQVRPDQETGELVLAEVALEIHAYDIEDQDGHSKPDSDNEQQSDLINDTIRRSPINISPVWTAAPVMSATRMQPAITVQVGGGNSLPSRPGTPPAMMTLASLQMRLNAALQWTGPPGGSGSGPDSPGGPGGPGGGPVPGQAPQQPVVLAGDVKMMGQLPQIFTGEQSKADNFIKEVKGYLHLNQDVAGFDLPIKKIVFTLTLIKGEDMAGWTRDMGDFLDGLTLADNIPDLWMQFLAEFGQQFQDMQRGDQAQAQLEGLWMHFPDINQYITKFEELARQAGYTAGNPETMHMFVKGLMPSVMEDVLKPPHVQGYHAIKQKAIECTWSRLLISDILKARQPGGRGFQGGAFHRFQRVPGQRAPFFARQQPTVSQGPPRYNSSNVLQWMNNTPVPMDVGWNRTLNYWGGVQAHWANFPPGGIQRPIGPQQPGRSTMCYSCRRPEHFAKDCKQGRSSWVSQMQEENDQGWNDDESEVGWPTLMATTKQSTILQVQAGLKAMTLEEKSKLASELGVGEDFTLAWSGQHWSGRAAIAMCIYQGGNQWQCIFTLILLRKEPRGWP
jgi:hypothetical protein